MGDAEGCGKDVPDSVENEYSEGMVYWIVCFLAKQYIEKTKEGSLIFFEHITKQKCFVLIILN